MDSQVYFSKDSYQSFIGTPYSDEPDMVKETQVGVWSSQAMVVPPTQSKKSKKKIYAGDATKTWGLTFINDEDISLAWAWLEAFEDPISRHSAR